MNELQSRPEHLAALGVPLALAQQERIDAALARLRAGSGELALSDPFFSNLYLFRDSHQYRWVDGDWPYVVGRTYDGSSHVLPLFALHEAPAEVVAELLQTHDCVYPQSQRQIDALDPALYVFDDSRDDADYLYPAANFRDYQGELLQKKRNLMRQLLAAQPLRSVPYSAALRDDALSVLRGWMADKGKASGDADERPCIEALEHAARFGLEGFVHYAQDVPAGFVLGQEVQPGVFVMRFAKGLVRYKGIAQYMFHHFVTALPRPVQWLNFEQDLGLANFRQTKMSYQPQALLRKFRVRLHNSAAPSQPTSSLQEKEGAR